jgi:four helix bundle protein
MQRARDHRDLRVWQDAVELGVRCYKLSRGFPRDERYGLTSQLRRAAVSVALNIAEGNGRFTRGEYLNQLSAARGSLREVDTLLEFVLRLEYAAPADVAHVREIVDATAARLTRLVMSLKENGNRS